MSSSREQSAASHGTQAASVSARKAASLSASVPPSDPQLMIIKVDNSDGSEGALVVKDSLPEYRDPPATDAADAEEKAVAAFLRWQFSLLNFYHRKIIMVHLNPLQLLVQPQRGIDVDLAERLKLTKNRGLLDLTKQGRKAVPSHSHMLSKRAACWRLNRATRSVEKVVIWGKKTVAFLAKEAGARKRSSGFLTSLGIQPSLRRIYLFTEAMGYIWGLPTPPPRMEWKLGGPPESKRGTSKRSRRSRRSSSTLSVSHTTQASARKEAGASPPSSALQTPLVQLKTPADTASDDEEEAEDDEPPSEAAVSVSAGAAKTPDQEEKLFIRTLEGRLLVHRRMVGCLLSEFAQLMQLLERKFGEGYNLPAHRKDVVAVGQKLPVNYTSAAHDALPTLPDHVCVLVSQPNLPFDTPPPKGLA